MNNNNRVIASDICLTIRRAAPIAVLAVSFFSLLVPPGFAADFSFTGAFQQDDERRDFLVTTGRATNLLIRTFSYGGGTNASGAAVPAGGFDPTIAVFDAAGLLIAVQKDSDCEGAQASFCWDARLNLAVPAGTYRVVLTQAENLPHGPFVEDGFVHDGAGNFTDISELISNSGFTDSSLNKRNGSFAVDILGVDTAQSGGVPNANALVSAASNTPAKVAPNTILTLYQQGLGGGTLRATVGGMEAAILFSNDTQMNFLVPQGVPVGTTVNVEVSRNGALLYSLPTLVQATSPALFTSNGSGSGQAAVLNQDYSANGVSNGAKPGQVVMVYGTGFGAALPPGDGGLTVLASGVSATVGGLPAEVLYAGMVAGATPGLQQINVKIPENSPLGAAVAIQLTAGGVRTAANTTLAIVE